MNIIWLASEKNTVSATQQHTCASLGDQGWKTRTHVGKLRVVRKEVTLSQGIVSQWMSCDEELRQGDSYTFYRTAVQQFHFEYTEEEMVLRAAERGARRGDTAATSSDDQPEPEHQPLELLECFSSHEWDILKLLSEESEQRSEAENRRMCDNPSWFQCSLVRTHIFWKSCLSRPSRMFRSETWCASPARVYPIRSTTDAKQRECISPPWKIVAEWQIVWRVKS